MTAPNSQARIADLERELHWAHLKIQKLEELLRQQRIKFLGPRSETLSDLQLELLTDQEPGVTAEEVAAEASREPITTKRERKSHPGRQRLPESLPRAEETIPCAVLRASDAPRKACLPPIRELNRGGCAVAGLDRRERSGERSRGDRNGGVQVLRSSAAVPPGSDSGARGGPGDRPRDAGWLGDARMASCSRR